jgi:hypothetical protein
MPRQTIIVMMLLSQQQKTLAFLKVRPEPIEVLVRELLSGADRLRLEATIAQEIRAIAPTIEQASVSMLKAAMTAAEQINGYIWKLSQDTLPLEQRVKVKNTNEPVFKKRPPTDGPLDLPENGSAFYQTFIRDWVASFLALTEKNAEGSHPSRFSLEEINALRRIMSMLSPK